MPDDIVRRLRQSHRVGCECFGCEAADEIERLRKLSGDAGQLRAERDAARAEVCLLRAPSTSIPEADDAMRAYAETRGWDCFKGKEEIDE